MTAADWPAALADIDTAVRAALADLDGYEGRWREVLSGWPGQRLGDAPGHGGTGASKTLTRPPEPVDGDPLDDRLAAVKEFDIAADRDLAGRADALTSWRESLQRALHLLGGEPCHGSR